MPRRLSAIELYRRLAELRPRNAFPRDWAATHQTLGEQESGTARLTEAVAAYREALKEPARASLQWPEPR